MEGILTYRDFVVHVFSALVLDVFILMIVAPDLLCDLFETKENYLLGSLIAIPLLYIEGHLLYALENLIFLKIINNKVRLWLFVRCKWLAKILFKHRMTLHKMLAFCKYNEEFKQKAKNEKNVKDKAEEQNDFKNLYELYKKLNRYLAINVSADDRHEALADLMKGLMFNSFIAMVLSIIYKEWILLAVFAGIFGLSYFRARKYAKFYVNRLFRELEKNKYKFDSFRDIIYIEPKD